MELMRDAGCTIECQGWPSNYSGVALSRSSEVPVSWGGSFFRRKIRNILAKSPTTFLGGRPLPKGPSSFYWIDVCQLGDRCVNTKTPLETAELSQRYFRTNPLPLNMNQDIYPQPR